MVEPAFVFRDAAPSDEDAVFELARHLDTLNLPPDRAFIRDLLERSADSFAGGHAPELFDPERRFLFVLEAPDGEVVGTSMIHAQHGTRHEPHVFFRVIDEERYAELAIGDERRDVHMVHKMLHLGLTYQGPTEIGGLVLHPRLRKHPLRLGRLLSLGRFVYIAAQRHRFRDRVLAELLPALERGPAGRARSRLWDALGGRFTNLTYAEADALTRDDKEFIWKLFPTTPVHASLLPREVQDIVGQVGPESLGAMRLLQSIGFTDSGKVDPFDGGPHWEAATDDLTLIRDAEWCIPIAGEVGEEGVPGFVARVGRGRPPYFRAVFTRLLEPIDDEVDWVIDWTETDAAPRELTIPRDDLDALGVRDDERVLVALRPQLRVAH
ncbi:arginine N-succinyltransferase [Nannocystaceae bacterium ST9]